MSNLCEKLLSGCISVSCDNPVFDGAESKAYIGNRSQLGTVTYDQNNPNLITDLTMAEVAPDVSATLFSVLQLGKTPYNGSNTTLVEGDISNTWTETVQFLVPDNSPAAAMMLSNIGNGKFFFIMENSYAGSDNKGTFQAYGIKKGLTCTGMERQVVDDTNQGGWIVTLTAEKQPQAALFINKTDAETTRTYLDSLTDCE